MKILHLDDHPLVTSGLKAGLAAVSQQYEVLAATSAKDGLHQLQTQTDIDLLILDLSMPDMDGLSFLRAMVARNVFVPVVIMSAREDLVLLREAVRMGVIGFLPKSWSAEQLVQALEKIARGEPTFPAHIEQGLAKMAKQPKGEMPSTLSQRQLEILKMVQSGLSNKGIAEVLYISEVTVKSHLQSIFKLLGAKNRIESVRRAEQLDILSKHLI